MPATPPRAALFSSASDDWPTPPDFHARLDGEFGFVLDVCSSRANHTAPTFYALDHPDRARRDGLARDWAADAAASGGGAVWMNPPYGRSIGAWMAKARQTARAGAVVVCLVPVRSSAAWWHDLVLASGAEVRYVRGRLTFGSATSTAPFASAVVIYRPTDTPGVPGPVGVMGAKDPAPTPTPEPEPTGTVPSTATEAPVVLEGYTPRGLPAMAWAWASDPVRAAVAAAGVRPRDAVTYAGDLVGFLARTPCWDKASIPDLRELLTLAAIDADCAARLAASRCRSLRQSRGRLRRLSAAVGASPPTRTWSYQRAISPAVLPLTRAATAAVPAASLLRTWAATCGLDPARTYLTRDIAATHPHLARTQLAGAITWPVSVINALTSAVDQRVTSPHTTHHTPARITTPARATSPTSSPAARAAASKRPMSRRAVLTAAKQLTALAAPTSEPSPTGWEVGLDPVVVGVLSSYRPVGAFATGWPAHRDLALALAAATRPGTANRARTVCSVLAGFLAWVHTWTARPTYPNPVTLADLSADTVAAWFTATDGAPASKATRRSIVRAALGGLDPVHAPVKVAYAPSAPPYTPEQAHLWRRLALTQPTPGRTRNLCFIVGLGLGAGFNAADLRSVTPDHFTVLHLPTGQVVWTVTTEHPAAGRTAVRSRTVPIRTDYLPLIQRGLQLHTEAGKCPSDPVVGLVPDRFNVTLPERRAAATTTDDQVVELTRLRNTWIVAAMCAAVPLADLLQAAGLSGSRTLADLLPYCPPSDPADTAAALAALGDLQGAR